jgi:hypothetical protein
VKIRCSSANNRKDFRAMPSKFQTKVAAGVAQYLEPGEHVLAAMSASLKGRSQTLAGNIASQAIGGSQTRKSREAAGAAEVALPKSQTIGIVVTDRRLLFLGLGTGASVKEFASAVPLSEIASITVKRFGLAGTTAINVRGSEITFEGRVGPGRELQESLAATRR